MMRVGVSQPESFRKIGFSEVGSIKNEVGFIENIDVVGAAAFSGDRMRAG